MWKIVKYTFYSSVYQQEYGGKHVKSFYAKKDNVCHFEIFEIEVAEIRKHAL